MKSKLLLVSICSVLGLALALTLACKAPATPAPVPTATVTVTAPAVTVTATPTPAATPTPTPKPTPTPTPTPAQLPKELIWTTSEVGSTAHAMAVGVSDLLMKRTPMKVTVRAVGGPAAWLPMFASDASDLGSMNFNDSLDAYRGLGGYKEATKGAGYDVRVIMGLRIGLSGPIVRADSKFSKIADLKGAKVASEFGGNLTFVQMTSAWLANGRLTYNDVTKVPVATGYGDDVKSGFLEGRIDMTLTTLGNAFAREINATKPIRHLSLDTSPEALAKSREFVIFEPYKATKGQAPGIVEDTYVMAVSINLFTRPSLSDDAVYAITKAIWQNFEELYPVHPDFKLMTRDIMVTTTATVPYHPGAIKFFKEVGVWNDNLEALQQKLLAKK
ncbi:MAG: TAXI family TRAP transporter solute-binding subunit [Chloroflexi bacterium]|nr:TAXI family TRAP transporter solute-binding subunit [Chloroflexota bacterium]